MDENQINKLIGYTVMAIIAYHILSYVIPYLFYLVMALVVMRILQEHLKPRR